MTIGSGIAVFGIWGAVAACAIVHSDAGAAAFFAAWATFWIVLS